ncbi:unnamed protein product [Gordionus sp. m RMFG-2023]
MAISVYSFANAKHNHNYRDIGQSYPIITCLFLSTLYVLGLYLWPNKYLRDDPVVIKYRFFSVLLTCLISPIFICWHISNKSDILIHLGIRKSGLIAAIFIPLFTLFVSNLFTQQYLGHIQHLCLLLQMLITRHYNKYKVRDKVTIKKLEIT